MWGRKTSNVRKEKEKNFKEGRYQGHEYWCHCWGSRPARCLLCEARKRNERSYWWQWEASSKAKKELGRPVRLDHQGFRSWLSLSREMVRKDMRKVKGERASKGGPSSDITENDKLTTITSFIVACKFARSTHRKSWFIPASWHDSLGNARSRVEEESFRFILKLNCEWTSNKLLDETSVSDSRVLILTLYIRPI